MVALLISVTTFALSLHLIYAKVHLDSTMPGIIIPLLALLQPFVEAVGPGCGAPELGVPVLGDREQARVEGVA